MKTARFGLLVAALAALFALQSGCQLKKAENPAEPAVSAAPEQPAEKPPARPAPPTLADVAVEKGLLLFRGKPVHPGAVRELVTCAADKLPIFAAVDLEGAERANRYHQRPSVQDGAVGFKDEAVLGKNAYFVYALVGVAPGGVHVLQTWDGAGGSGVFTNVLLVRFEADRERTGEGERARVVMKRVGQIPLGDRDDGKVSLEGNALRLGKSKYRAEDVVIKLD